MVNHLATLRFGISVILPAVALCFPLAGRLDAQEETGNLYVVAVDLDDARLPGVTLELSGQGATQVRVTDELGETRFLSLDPGRWSLRATLEGFSPLEQPAIDIRVARNTTVEVRLAPGIEEAITVTAESPLLDSRKLSTGTTVSQVELEKIPTARDPWAILNQTPGVLVSRINVGGNESGQQSAFRAPGVSDLENSFLVDGVEITDMAAGGASSTYYDFDQFTEMQFQTGGNDITKAAAGVSVNLVTKRGSNEFRGSARFLRTDDDFFHGVLTQEVAILTGGHPDLAPDQVGFIGNSVNQVTEYGFEAGGPLLLDRIWLWGSFGVNDIKNRTGGATEADVQSDDTVLESTSFKVNAQLTSGNSAVGSWNNGDKRKFGRAAGPTRPAPTTWNQRGPSALVKFEDTHVFGSHFFLGGSYAKMDGGFSLSCLACIVAGGLESAPETAWDADGVWQNSWLSGTSQRPSAEWKLDGSYFFTTAAVSHELKFGGRLREFETVSPFHWPGRDVLHVDGQLFGIADPVDLLIAHRGETPLVSQTYDSLWIQDTLTHGDLTVNAGFRYDLQDGRNEPYSIPGNAAFPELLPAIDFEGRGSGFDWETISPRVGVTWALGRERATLLRGSLARFPEQLETVDILRSNPLGNAYATYLFADGNGNDMWEAGETLLGLIGWSGFDPGDPAALRSPNATAPGLDPSVVDEIVLGAEHAIRPELVVGAAVTWRRTRDVLNGSELVVGGRPLILDSDSGAPRPVTVADYVEDVLLTGTLPDGSPYAVQTYSLGCAPDCLTGGTLLENTDRRVEYLGLTLQFTKRLSRRWMARGYVTSGKAEWDIGESYLAGSDPNPSVLGIDVDGGLFVGSATNNFPRTSPLQSSWMANLNGMYQVAPDRPWGFNVSANLYAREGYPVPYFRSVVGADGVTRAIRVTGKVDDYRTEDILTVDARLEKEFGLTGEVGLTTALEAFNLLDEAYTLERENLLNAGQADFLRKTLSPRVWRLGVRLRWR